MLTPRPGDQVVLSESGHVAHGPNSRGIEREKKVDVLLALQGKTRAHL